MGGGFRILVGGGHGRDLGFGRIGGEAFWREVEILAGTHHGVFL